MNSESGDIVNDYQKSVIKCQLTEFGLEFFAESDDLETQSLSLDTNLLSQEPVISFVNANASKEQTCDDLNNFGLISSEKIGLIKVLPVLIENNLDSSYQNAISSTTSLLRTSVKQPQTVKKTSSNVRKILPKITVDECRNKLDQKVKVQPVQKLNSKVHLMSDTNDNCDLYRTMNGFGDSIRNQENDFFMKLGLFSTDSELDNKINDSLLDLLNDKVINKNNNSVSSIRTQEKTNEREDSKFVTIFPSKNNDKVINLLVKGKTCRSKQPLSDVELRVVTKILNEESIKNHKNTYRDIYYDAESNATIRYEVKLENSSENNDIAANVTNIKTKKGKTKNNLNAFAESNHSSINKDEKYKLKCVARTRCGRISRPPSHVIRDYKRLKHLTNFKNEGDEENENNGGYADYQDVNNQTVSENNELYGPLEPIKRQFSSLSLCPTCGKVYLGYQRMAIHFQKYPEHKNEELLKRLLHTKKKPFDESAFSDNSEITRKHKFVSTVSNPLLNNKALRRKRKMCRKIKIRTAKNTPVELKELLSVCEVDQIVNYAGPVVAKVLSSWEYLLMRSRQLKKDEETLVASFLKEISLLLKQIRELSHDLLKPCFKNKENIPNTFIIENEDILQHVLGVSPGEYVITDDKNWPKEFSCVENNNIQAKKNSNIEISKNTTKLVNENSYNEQSEFVDLIVDNMITERSYKAGERVGLQSLDFSHRIKNHDFNLNSNTTLPAVVDINTNVVNFDCVIPNLSDKQTNMFSSDKLVNESSTRSEFSDEQINTSTNSRQEFDAEYNSSNSLNFDSFVNNPIDIINDFPISLPSLSDNSSDSKDCLHLLRTPSAEDLLDSLKHIDNTDSMIAEFEENVNHPTTPCMLDFYKY